jgi:hypothetical protein
MSDQSPFSNWPNLDKNGAPPPLRETQDEARPVKILPGSHPEEPTMASNNALENFLGGSPVTVMVKLLFISLIVGALLMWLELRPIDIFHGIQSFFNRIYELGFDAVHVVLEYVLAGAVIVIPAWFILRLLNAGGKR